MKNTGVIRKIDNLGRIVIPKEIRKVLKIDSDDDLEIYVDDKKIILQKYLAFDSIDNHTDKIVNLISNLVGGIVLITDKDKVITSGKYYHKEINDKLKNIIKERKEYISDEELIQGLKGSYIINPIIQNSDANGLVIIFKKTKVTEEDKIIAKILKNIVENT